MDEHTTTKLTVYDDNVWMFTVAAEPTPESFQTDFIDKVNAMLQRKTPFSLIFDTRDVLKISFPVSRQVMKWMSQVRPRLAGFLRSTAIVVNRELVRGVLNTVFMLQKPVAPMMTVSTIEDAWGFINDDFST